MVISDNKIDPSTSSGTNFISKKSDIDSGHLGRVLGIDYGEKRIGLAISDESRTLAREFAILPPKEFFRQIKQIIADNQINRIALGWPLNMTGAETKKTKEVRNFKQELEKLIAIPIEAMDERLSSQMAQNLPGGDKNVDSLAAQLILQNYLDKNKNK